MANQYQTIHREVKEAQEFWGIVKREYDQGLNNYFRGRKQEYYGHGLESEEEIKARCECELHNFMFRKGPVSRRLRPGGE